MQSPRRRNVKRECIQYAAAESFALAAPSPQSLDFIWHQHPEFELTLNKTGGGRRFVDDSINPFAAGDLCLIYPNVPHGWFSEITAERYDYVMVHFLPVRWGREFLALPENRHIQKVVTTSAAALTIRGPTRESVVDLLLDMVNTPAGYPERLLRLIEIVSRIGQSIGSDDILVQSPSRTPQHSSAHDPAIARALELLGNDMSNIPSQREIAHAVDMQPAAFSRLFRAHMGKTFTDYVTDLRIGHACRALAETDLPITRIAFAAGFANLSNFNRQFQHAKHMTPREFRKLSLSAYKAKPSQ